MVDQDQAQVKSETSDQKVKKEWPLMVWILIGVAAGVLTRWLLLE
jgi:hypothetical protein